jgi:hypothetical protein
MRMRKAIRNCKKFVGIFGSSYCLLLLLSSDHIVSACIAKNSQTNFHDYAMIIN